MSQENDEPTETRPASEIDPEDQQPATPFDPPFFLPILLGAGCLWFGYDGWINQDPEMLEHVSFNRWGFGVLVILTGLSSFRAKKEIDAEREERSSDSLG